MSAKVPICVLVTVYPTISYITIGLYPLDPNITFQALTINLL